MKNKRLIYLLLPVVLLIWGLIFYRVWASTTQPEASPLVRVALETAPAPSTPAARPTLALNYPDPFLREAAPRTRVPPAENNTTFGLAEAPRLSQPVFHALAPPPPAAPPLPPAVWPLLEYVGTIENQQQHTRVAMVKINGSQYVLRAQDEQQGVTVKTIYSDSIRVQFQRQLRVVLRLGNR